MELTVVQWNIWYQEDIANIAQFLKHHNPDVVCLQELTVDYANSKVQHTPQFIAEQLGFNYYHKELPIEATDGTKMMLANGIFSRFPIKTKRSVWLNEPKAGGGYGDEYRAYVEVTLDVAGKSLSVGTTHMSYTHRFQVTPAKKQETERLITELSKHSEAFIFAGDLNAAPDSYTVSEISKFLKNSGPDVNEKTWTTKPFLYKGFEETDLDWRLDYCFTTADIQTESAEVIPTVYSDHLPLLVRLRV